MANRAGVCSDHLQLDLQLCSKPKTARRSWITPGAFVGVGLWLAVSFGFRIYLGYFDSYSLTYGSLGALIVLMLWFYLTGVAILIGGEVNCEFQPECERDP